MQSGVSSPIPQEIDKLPISADYDPPNPNSKGQFEEATETLDFPKTSTAKLPRSSRSGRSCSERLFVDIVGTSRCAATNVLAGQKRSKSGDESSKRAKFSNSPIFEDSDDDDILHYELEKIDDRIGEILEAVPPRPNSIGARSQLSEFDGDNNIPEPLFASQPLQKERKKKKKPKPLPCPVEGCSDRHCGQKLMMHISVTHCKTMVDAESNWGVIFPLMKETKKWFCPCCLYVNPDTTRCAKCNRIPVPLESIFPGAQVRQARVDAIESVVALLEDQLAAQPRQDARNNIQPEAEKIIKKILTTRCPTISYCPKRLRLAWSQLFTAEIRGLLNDFENVHRWARFFSLPKLIFGLAAEQSKKKNGKSHGQIVKRNLEEWKKDDWMHMWEQLEQALAEKTSPRSTRSSKLQEKFNISRCVELAKLGRYGDASKALISNGLASDERVILLELKDKYPVGSIPALPEEPVPAPLIVDEKEVLSKLKSFARGTAPGGSGLKAQHILDATFINGSSQQAVMEVLTVITNRLLAGSAPAGIAAFLAGAPVTALAKPDSGIRPIAVGEILRRLVGKCASASVVPRLGKEFQPLQVGVGTRGGCEATIHSTATILHRFGGSNRYAMLKIDFKNAFNCFFRESMFREVRKKCPEIAAWVEFTYGGSAFLWYKDAILESFMGVQQGDPLGPILFALILQPMLLRLQAECPKLLANMWYLDDGTLIGTYEDLNKALLIIQEESAVLGLVLNLGKCEIWWPQLDMQAVASFPDQIKRVTTKGIKLLGSGVGDADYIDNVIGKQKVGKIEEILKMLKKVEDPQIQLHLLRVCYVFPKFNYLIRTCPPGTLKKSLSDLDNLISSLLFHIVGNDLSALGIRQLSLPISMGGFGIILPSKKTHSAFLGSISQTSNLQCAMINFPDGAEAEYPAVQEACDQFNLKFTQENQVDLSLLKTTFKPQQVLSRKENEVELADMISSSTQRDRARLNAVSLPHAGDWLLVPPIQGLNFKFSPSEFRDLVRYRLGIQVFEKGSACPMPKCKEFNDTMGDHAVVCSSTGQRIARHNAVRDVLFDAFRKAQVNPSTEDRGLLGTDTNEAPGDIFVYNWAGKQLAIDVSITSPLTVSALTNGSADKPGMEIEFRQKDKIKKYGARCTERNIVFHPFVMNTFGGMDQTAVDLIKRVGVAISRRSALSIGEERKYLFQRISMALQKRVAGMFLSRTQY